MSKKVKLLITKNEPFIKFFLIGKKTLLQTTAYIFLAMSLFLIDISTAATGRNISLTDHADAAENREIMLFPTEKLSMVVLYEGTAPELKDIKEQNTETVITYDSNENIPELLGDAIDAAEGSKEVLSSKEYVADKLIELLATDEIEKNISEKKHDISEKEEEKKVNSTLSLKADQKIKDEAEAKKAEEAARKAEEERLKATYVNNPNMVIKLTESELDLMERLVECEAGGEDMVGKILVANVIINRVNSSQFQNTVEGVINSPKQFQPVGSGLINKTTASSATKEAVRRALSGEDYSKDALYFICRRYASKSGASWFDRNLEKVVQHGSHEFFK